MLLLLGDVEESAVRGMEQRDAQWEPDDTREDAQQPKSRRAHVPALLEAYHLGVVWRERRREDMPRPWILVVVETG